MKLTHFPLIASLLITACTVGPDYQKPDINVPAQFVSQEVFNILNQGQDEQTHLQAQWWRGFNDEILNDLVTAALENNYQIAAAAARVEQARAGVDFADSGDSLSAGTSASADLQERRNLSDGDSTTDTSAGGGVTAILPLDVFGQNRREMQAAIANLDAAKADLRDVILDISTNVTSEYLTLRGNQRQLELLRESVQLQEKTLSIVRSRFDAGLAPELDLQRARTSVENLRADIPPLEASLKNSRNRLASLSGNFPGTYEDLLNRNTNIPDYDAPLPQSIPLTVLGNRPDIASAEANLKQAVANIGVAQADFYPSFELNGAVNVTASGITGGSSTDLLIASVGTVINQILFDGGARQANVDSAEARADEAVALYQQALRDGIVDVETVLNALLSSLQRQESLANAVTSSQRSFSQAETLYQQGLISFLDVVDAQRVLANARQALAREKTNYATQIATLFNALGLVSSVYDKSPITR